MQIPRKRILIPAVLVVVVALVVVFWNWDWFIPLAEGRASAALGRPVKITHLHVQLARQPIVEADGITVENPADFPAGPPFATIDKLRAQLDAGAYLHGRNIVIPWIEVDRPVVEVRAETDGAKNNYTFKTAAPSAAPGPQIGDLRIADGHVHVLLPKTRADFEADIATREAAGGQPSQIVVGAKGTYASQPITGQLIGGALLSLRDPAHPYPVDLKLANGPTKVSLVGTLQDPLAFTGADLKLNLSGPDMSLLFPLTGVPIPETPAYSIVGQLDYANRKIRFTHFAGKVGSSDIEGDVEIDPGADREKITANLSSRLVDLADLGGFIGTVPGRMSTPNQSAAQKQQLARAEASSRLIPNVPINLPKLRATDVELHYKGAKIQGRSIPFDSIRADLSIADGKLALHPLVLTVGKGEISGNIALDGKPEVVHTRADITFRQVDLNRIMSSTHAFGGAGAIGGKAVIDGNGNSLAALLGSGSGELKLFMSQGGNLSALLVDLSGLELGNALLSALGVPVRTAIRCLVTDFVLQRGQLGTRIMLLDTDEANITGTGDINLRDETIKFRLRTEAKHFSIGSLPTDILVDGKLKRPSIGPDPVELAARVGAAVGLGVLLTPLGALLPTIQLGLGDDNACGPLIRQAQAAPTIHPEAVHPAARPATRSRTGR